MSKFTNSYDGACTPVMNLNLSWIGPTALSEMNTGQVPLTFLLHYANKLQRHMNIKQFVQIHDNTGLDQTMPMYQ